MDGDSGLVSVLALALWVSLAGIIYPFKPFGSRWVALVSFLVCLAFFNAFSPPETTSTEAKPRPLAASEDEERFWVTAARLNRRTCPSANCGIVGQFLFREGVTILERRNGWARVSKPYDASCFGGLSEYVDAGNAVCDPANGITNGQLAEWVAARYLAEDRPPDPARDASGVEELVSDSDDFARYRTAFAQAAQSLIAQRRCTERHFREMGGWWKSSSHRNQPIYFTYCGATTSDRLYLNADTGEVFQ